MALHILWAVLMILLAWWTLPSAARSEVYHRTDRPGITVFSPPALNIAAGDIADLFPRLGEELADRFGWAYTGETIVWLLDDEAQFQRMIGRPFFAAFVMPETGVMVIDNTKTRIHPLTLETILKHELCHLLLHQHISAHHLPKWLDEGVAQWASDGISELLAPGSGDALRRAVLSGKLPSMAEINHYFMLDQPAVQLAYEASRSIVDYVVRRYGVAGLLRVLSELKGGRSPETSIPAALGVTLGEIEAGWQGSLEKTDIWWRVTTVYLYDLLFFAAAVITLVAFVRGIVRKRRYSDEVGAGTSDDADENGFR
ncbi:MULTISPECIES: peptidase MA family metallohydrolase [Desulfococcus]|uniref:Peptidase MA-like domain-containing protein n=1 Tax=Desulfococcus multivorans DSM 2059 TaxID=1121405 RepID=S7UXE0_DESML|nr:peptidase MA family metallohydrolase [Desulfococcus multivorans]EPR38879.1 hypothetical protein dsmv_0289 [Desulfococcus multivorans DSM 2059]MDX9818576.1 peptidase MA family metallohydrolase [Desulfococcus multivorans]SJZ68172.1 Peptidase MA superfamily protein [Desulfococcus multivorans DSM 2059]